MLTTILKYHSLNGLRFLQIQKQWHSYNAINSIFMNHGCHLILTENGHQLQNTSSMEIKRPYKRCNEDKKEMAVSIPTSTINQVTMLVIFFIRLVVQFIIIITLSTSFMFHVCRLHHLFILTSNVNRTLPSSTISCMPIIYIAIIITFITTIILLIVKFSSLELAPSP